MTEYAAILKSINNPTLPVCDLNKIEMGDVPVLEMTMDMSGALQDMEKKGAPQAAAFTQMLMGGGRSTVHLAAADSTTVVMAWGELENLRMARRKCQIACRFFTSRGPGNQNDRRDVTQRSPMARLFKSDGLSGACSNYFANDDAANAVSVAPLSQHGSDWFCRAA